MGYGNELIIGWYGRSEIEKACDRIGLGLRVDWDERDVENLESLQTQIEAIWPDAIRELIIPHEMDVSRIKHPRHGEDVYVIHPLKEQHGHEITPWSCWLYYDPDEMGDTEDMAVFGVSLITRYKPTFLDWRETHGGSGNNFPLNPKNISDIEMARSYLSSVVPVFGTAYTNFVSRWY